MNEDKAQDATEDPPTDALPRAQIREPLPSLVLVSTPIGNLQDLSDRAREVLSCVNVILCEDTRTSAVLLRTHNIRQKCIALHEHNEEAALPRLIESMQAGQRFALISDAGTPLVSDPGYRLVRATIDAGLSVSGVPGPNAAVLALTLSGLPPQPFLFTGFLPPRHGARRAAMAALRGAELAGLNATHVFYEAPHRLAAFLTDAMSIFGPRPAAVCRELTKHFEEVRRDTLATLAAHYTAVQARGEIVVVIGPAGQDEEGAKSLEESLRVALARMSVKDAAAAVAAATGLPKKQVYRRALELLDQG